jgi:hypothetical protein
VSAFEHRSRLLPAGLVNDQPLAMLLHLFIRLFDNEPISVDALAELAGSPLLVGRRWAKYLTTLDLIREAHDEGDVTLTLDGLALLREFLGTEGHQPILPW